MRKLTQKELEIVRKFKSGYWMIELAIIHNLEPLGVERIIRKALKAQKEKNATEKS